MRPSRWPPPAQGVYEVYDAACAGLSEHGRGRCLQYSTTGSQFLCATTKNQVLPLTAATPGSCRAKFWLLQRLPSPREAGVSAYRVPLVQVSLFSREGAREVDFAKGDMYIHDMAQTKGCPGPAARPWCTCTG